MIEDLRIKYFYKILKKESRSIEHVVWDDSPSYYIW